MYCAVWGSSLAACLRYCNRWGISLKERSSEAKTVSVAAYVTGITNIGIAGLSLMLGGAIALKNGGDFHEELIWFLMVMTFAIVGVVVLSLCRQLSRLNRSAENR